MTKQYIETTVVIWVSVVGPPGEPSPGRSRRGELLKRDAHKKQRENTRPAAPEWAPCHPGRHCRVCAYRHYCGHLQPPGHAHLARRLCLLSEAHARTLDASQG